MKYFIIGLLGFILHKGVEEIYEYSFKKGFTSDVCRSQYLKDIKDPKIDAPLSKRFQCASNEMGSVVYLSYILLRPHWAERKEKNESISQ